MCETKFRVVCVHYLSIICLLVHYLSAGCLKRGFTRFLYCLIEISLLFNPFLCFDFISMRWQSALFHILSE